MAEKDINGFPLPFGFKSNNPMYNSDEYAGPYDTIEDAMDTIVPELRTVGRPVGIYSEDFRSVILYCFELDNNDDWILVRGIPDPLNPADYDLDEFQNESADPFVRESEIPIPELLEAGKNILISDNEIAVDIPPIENVSSILGTTGNTPNGIVIDSVGNVYTSDQSSRTVTKITPNGVSSIHGTTGTAPCDIVIDSRGNIYTANQSSNNVTKITPDGVSSIHGTTGPSPNGITIDSEDNVYTVNSGGSTTVTKITPEGVKSTLSAVGSNPSDIVIDSDGNIYIVNYNSSNVTKITPEGVSSIFATIETGFNSITLDSDGNIYIVNYNSSTVTKITPEGVSSIFGTAGNSPRSITLDSDGNVYAANYSSSNVTKITPDGVANNFGTTGNSPYAIVLDSNGNVYTANYGANNVTKITVDNRRNLAVDDDGKIIRTDITDDFEPSKHDLDEFRNASADPFVRESEVPTPTELAGIQNANGLSAANPAATMADIPSLFPLITADTEDEIQLNQNGNLCNSETPNLNKTFTWIPQAGGVQLGGQTATVLIKTEIGDSDFPTVDGAEYIEGAEFEEDAVYDLYLFHNNNVVAYTYLRRTNWVQPQYRIDLKNALISDLTSNISRQEPILITEVDVPLNRFKTNFTRLEELKVLGTGGESWFVCQGNQASELAEIIDVDDVEGWITLGTTYLGNILLAVGVKVEFMNPFINYEFFPQKRPLLYPYPTTVDSGQVFNYIQAGGIFEKSDGTYVLVVNVIYGSHVTRTMHKCTSPDLVNWTMTDTPFLRPSDIPFAKNNGNIFSMSNPLVLENGKLLFLLAVQLPDNIYSCAYMVVDEDLQIITSPTTIGIVGYAASFPLSIIKWENKYRLMIHKYSVKQNWEIIIDGSSETDLFNALDNGVIISETKVYDGSTGEGYLQGKTDGFAYLKLGDKLLGLVASESNVTGWVTHINRELGIAELIDDEWVNDERSPLIINPVQLFRKYPELDWCWDHTGLYESSIIKDGHLYIFSSMGSDNPDYYLSAIKVKLTS